MHVTRDWGQRGFYTFWACPRCPWATYKLIPLAVPRAYR